MVGGGGGGQFTPVSRHARGGITLPGHHVTALRALQPGHTVPPATYLLRVLPKHSYGQFAVTGTISSGWSILTSLLSQNTNHLATRASLGPS